jgi:hypothetical protein
MLMVGCGLLRLVAPHVRSLVASRELARPDMAYMEAGRRFAPVDGVWSPAELPRVQDALEGRGDRKILEAGRERAEALIRGGCPVCENADCGKLFPAEVPEHCDRCGHKMPTLKG